MFKLCDYCAKLNDKPSEGYLILPEMGLCSSCGAQRGLFFVYNKKPKKKKSSTSRRYKDKGNICHYCHLDMTSRLDLRTLDHKIPKSKGGSNREDNILIACRDCNFEKGSMDYDDYIALVKERKCKKSD